MKRMPTTYKETEYQTVVDLWRDHFDLKVPANRFYEALTKNPHLSIDEAVATIQVRQKTIEALRKKKRFYIASYLEGDCLEGDAYGIDLVVVCSGKFLRITKNFQTNNIDVSDHEEIEVDSSYDDLNRIEKNSLINLVNQIL